MYVLDVKGRHLEDLPESSRSRSGLLLSTELRFDGIGKLGFGRFFSAAKACCTASCRTSVYVFFFYANVVYKRCLPKT